VDARTDRPRAEPRQRWRLVVGRVAEVAGVTQRDVGEAWERTIVESGLPIAWSEADRPRPRISFGAPLPVGVAADRELIDVVLTERLPAWRVREALAARTPPGWSIAELHDVWLAGPPLAGRVVAADYRIELAREDLDGEVAAAAIERLRAARSIPRLRAKGGGTVEYDLRPLLVELELVGTDRPLTIRARTRFHAELGTGRPEEVVGALGDSLGRPLEAASIVRERLLLAEDLEVGGGGR
jgi:radical SAM-linked protein